MRELISFAKQCSSTKHGTKCEATAMVDNGFGIIYTYVAHKPDSESSKPDTSLVRGHCIAFLGETRYSHTASLDTVSTQVDK